MNSFATLADKVTEGESARLARGKVAIMESFSIWHWIIIVMVFPLMTSPMLGIIRGVKNLAVFHALMSAFMPAYGLIYFFVAKRPRGN